MRWAIRALGGTLGTALLLLAGLKAVDGANTVRALPVLLATCAEFGLGLLLLLGAWPRTTAVAASLLGAILTGWTLFAGPESDTKGGAACGCFGRLDVDYFLHVLIAAALLGTAGLLVVLHSLPSRGAERRPPDPAEGGRSHRDSRDLLVRE